MKGIHEDTCHAMLCANSANLDPTGGLLPVDVAAEGTNTKANHIDTDDML